MKSWWGVGTLPLGTKLAHEWNTESGKITFFLLKGNKVTDSGCRLDTPGEPHILQTGCFRPFFWPPDLSLSLRVLLSELPGAQARPHKREQPFVSRHTADFWQRSRSSRKFTLFLAPGREYEQDLAWVCFQLEKPFGGVGLRGGGGVVARSSWRVRAAEINISSARESNSCNYICPMTYNQHS